MNTEVITPFVPPPAPKAADQPEVADTEAAATIDTSTAADPREIALEKLSVEELKTELTEAWNKYHGVAEEEMAPLLYQLRTNLKAQGITGAGFGAWVEENVEISRRTADRWADAYAVSRGLKKPPKSKKATFRQMSKSPVTNPDGKATVSLQLSLPEDEAEQFRVAIEILGDEATRVIRDAVISAARDLKKPAESVGTQPMAAERTGDRQ